MDEVPYRSVTYRDLSNLLYQRTMQFAKGSEIAKALPTSTATLLKSHKRKLMEDDRNSSSAMRKLMLEHMRETLDFESYYSMPKSAFDLVPKQDLRLHCTTRLNGVTVSISNLWSFYTYLYERVWMYIHIKDKCT